MAKRTFQDVIKHRRAANQMAAAAGLPVPFPLITFQPNGVIERSWKGEIQSVEIRSDRDD